MDRPHNDPLSSDYIWLLYKAVNLIMIVGNVCYFLCLLWGLNPRRTQQLLFKYGKSHGCITKSFFGYYCFHILFTFFVSVETVIVWNEFYSYSYLCVQSKTREEMIDWRHRFNVITPIKRLCSRFFSWMPSECWLISNQLLQQ